MNIVDYNTYSNQIYKAIVVNSNFQQDPQGEGRIQIYIPDMQYEYSDIYKVYMNSSDKASTGNMDKFPWAITLVANLKEGNIVYGNFIQNNYSQFIILGLDANNPANSSTINNTNNIGKGYNITGDTLLEYTCAIIISNEVGIEPSQYPNNIPDYCYSHIDPDDNGAWSIGLIQWNKTKAFNLLCYIKDFIPDWEDYWSDKSLLLYQDIKNGKANNYNYEHYKMTEGTVEYYAVKNMLSCEKGKEAQLNYSSKEVYEYIRDLQDNYDISNPAVIIWLSDLMNQYGSGYTNTKNIAKTICDSVSDNIQALNLFIEWCSINYETYNTYITRRENTKAYIVELESQGKLSSAGLIDQGVTTGVSQGAYLSGNGQYSYPIQGNVKLTSTWGGNGYPSGGAHNGIDLSTFGKEGLPLFACTSGELEQKGSPSNAFGYYSLLWADDGNLIIYAHQSEHSGGDRRVNKGDLIGYSGNTGNSTGPHLHIGITSVGNGEAGLWNKNWIMGKDPLPFFNITEPRGSTLEL